MAKSIEQVEEEYVKGGWTHCPRCGSDNIESTWGWDTDDNWATQNVKCNKCKLWWKDGYTLSFIEFGPEDVNPDGTLKEVENG